MTTRIREFRCIALKTDPASFSTSTSFANYLNFAKALPDSKVFYAIKANPAPEDPQAPRRARLPFRRRLRLLDPRRLRSRRLAGPHLLWQHHQEGDRDRGPAFRLGVTLFAVDCEAEVEKAARRSAAA